MSDILDSPSRKTRFFVTLLPLIFFFIRHKVHRIPGGSFDVFRFVSSQTDFHWTAYTQYAFFEWALIMLDVLYDSITEAEFKDAQIQVRHSIHSQLPRPMSCS